MVVTLPIYMDNNSTTRVDPRVLERMLPYFSEDFGNAASRSHTFGWKAESAVEVAREQVASLMGGSAREIIFTSGATEATNLALFGVAQAYASAGNQIITQATEHKAVLDPLKVLERQGIEVTILPVDETGRVDPQAVEQALSDKTILVSVMAANNEVGTLQPLEAIGALCRERGVVFHCDAAQAAGKLPFDVDALGISLASITAHKMYGPKGVGALYVRRKDPRVRLNPQIHGGGHERGLRSGTLNVPAIVGFGAACELCAAELEGEGEQLTALRDLLSSEIVEGLEGVHLNGHPAERLPGNLNLSFDGLDGEALMMAMREVAVSSGSACTSASLEPSHVLRAMGLSSERAQSSVRFGLGRFNTADEVSFVAAQVVEKGKALRELANR